MNRKEPRVAVIILNWNGVEDTIECLESLRKCSYKNYEIVVVDNASEGDDTRILRERFGDYIHIIENDRNYGYTGGNNIGIRYCLDNLQPEYLLVLNNDTVVAPDCLTSMVEIIEGDAYTGIAGPKVYYHDYPDVLQSAGVLVSLWKGTFSSIGNKEIDIGQYDEPKGVDAVHGCCLLIRTEVIQNIGLFDESYFCYLEENDYCVRAGRAGYRVLYAPPARIWHRKQLRRSLYARLLSEEKTSNLTYYFCARNRFGFMRKHAGRWQYIVSFFYFFAFHFWLQAAVCLLDHRNPGQFIALLRGTRDGLLKSDSGTRLYRKD